MNVPTLSTKALDVLMPIEDASAIDTGYLVGFLRQLSVALDGAGELEEWAWQSIHRYPSAPTKDEVAELFPTFTLPMPEWV